MKEVAFSQSSLKEIEADLEKQISELRAKHADKIRQHQETIKDCTKKLQAYVIANPENFEKKRSMDLVHGVIGLRVSTPSVVYDRGFSKKAVGLLKELGLTDFIRSKEEVNKEKIIESRKDKELMTRMATCGIKVQQKETFFCEPKEELVEV